MKKLFIILFSVAILSLGACQDPNEEIFNNQDEMTVDNNQSVRYVDFDSETD